MRFCHAHAYGTVSNITSDMRLFATSAAKGASVARLASFVIAATVPYILISHGLDATADNSWNDIDDIATVCLNDAPGARPVALAVTVFGVRVVVELPPPPPDDVELPYMFVTPPLTPLFTGSGRTRRIGTIPS
jgi:hypothetical protein